MSQDQFKHQLETSVKSTLQKKQKRQKQSSINQTTNKKKYKEIKEGQQKN